MFDHVRYMLMSLEEDGGGRELVHGGRRRLNEAFVQFAEQLKRMKERIMTAGRSVLAHAADAGSDHRLSPLIFLILIFVSPAPNQHGASFMSQSSTKRTSRQCENRRSCSARRAEWKSNFNPAYR